MRNIKTVLRLAFTCLALAEISRHAGGYCDAAIIYPKAPEGGQPAAYEHVRSILQVDHPFLGGFRIDELTIADPHQNYGFGPMDLASEQLLSAAKPCDWTYLFIHGTNAVGAARLVADAKTGKAPRFNGLFQSNFSDQTLEALRTAQQLPQIQKQDYELRRLECPCIFFVAVWLHGKSDDIIIPLGSTFGTWQAYQPYSEKQMIALLKPAAEKRLKETLP
jgi:hypothetical protein